MPFGFFKNKIDYKKRDLTPDEIFLDSKNVSPLDRERLDGRLVLPISERIFYLVFFLFLILFLFFFARIIQLQIVDRKIYEKRANLNMLKEIPIYPHRGIIYDRFKNKLAWNSPSFQLIVYLEKVELNEEIFSLLKNLAFSEEEIREAQKNKEQIILGDFQEWTEIEKIIRIFKTPGSVQILPASQREYINFSGFSHLLGYLGYPQKGRIKTGLSGVEKVFEEELAGRNGIKFLETDSKGKIISEFVKNEKKDGKELVLTIDGSLQNVLYRAIEEIVLNYGFNAGAGVILKPDNGEILALTSFPEFNSKILSRGNPENEIKKFLSDAKKPFYNRATEGLYPPGSSFKPLVALAALNEKLIDPYKKIYTNGSLSLPNPYDSEKRSVFLDWKNHGFVDLISALAQSSNVYFYIVGGGFEGQKGLGVNLIKKYAEMFGFGNKTGIEIGEEKSFIADSSWKKENQPNDPLWRIGDTYNLSVGQGYVLVTPIQMAKFISAVAMEGKMIIPHLVQNQDKNFSSRNLVKETDLGAENFKIVKIGLEKAVAEGTARALSGLGVKVAGKTGTAETGKKNDLINSWFISYLPAENPKLAIAVVLEEGKNPQNIGAPAAVRKVVEWLVNNRKKEYNL